MKMTSVRTIPLLLALSIVTSACSMKGKDEGFMSRMGRFLASADTIESEMASVRSMIQEFNTNGTKIVHLYTYPTTFKLASFKDNTRVTSTLTKLKSIRTKLLEETSKVDPSTKEGKKLLNLTADYLQAVVTMNKFMAIATHMRSINGAMNYPTSYSWAEMDHYNLVIDKRYALVLLSKVNFYASHLDESRVTAMGLDTKTVKSAVEVKLGGEARQMLEHLALNNPNTPSDYARLLKYNAVRETLINTWGINRIASSPYDPATDDYQAKTTLTFRPGADGKFTSGEYYKELMQSDKYYNIYLPVLKEVVAATVSTVKQRVSIASPEEYAEIYRTLIWGYPEDAAKQTIAPFAPVSDYFLSKGKYEGEVPYTKDDIAAMFTGEEVMTVEEQDWAETKAVNLFYTALVGDDLNAKAITKKMVEYAWITRSTAVVTQIRHRIQNADLTNVEVTKLTNKVWQIVGRWKDRYITSLTAIIEPMLSKELNNENLLKVKKNAKYASMYEALTMTEAARATYVLNRIKNGVPAHRMLPRTPESLIAMTQYMLGDTHTKQGLLFALNDNATIAGIVKNVYKDLSDAFYKRAKVTDTLDTMTQILWEELHNTAFKYYKKYPYTSNDRMQQYNEDYMRTHPAAPVDNTYVHINPWVPNPNYKVTPTPTPKPAKTSTNAKTEEKQEVTLDQKLIYMMQAFQPYMQDQDFSASTKSEAHPKYINIKYENWKNNETYKTANRVLWDLFYLMNVQMTSLEATGKYTKTQQFAMQPRNQEFLANQAVEMFYQAAPLLRNEIYYKTIEETFREPGDGMGFKGRTYTVKTDVYQTALYVIAEKAYDTKTGKPEIKKTYQYIADAINSAMKSLRGQKHGSTPATPFKEGLLETFAKANPSSYGSDKRFNFMYDKLEQLRGIMISGSGGQPQAVVDKMEKLDYELYKKVHPWKYRYDRYIEPYVHIAIMVLMVVSLVVGFFFPPAAIPAWLATSLFVFEVSAFTFTMASNVGYRIMYQRMYEIPANLKMQTHLASIQGAEESPMRLMYNSAAGIKSYGINTPLESWDRLKQAQKDSIDETRSMILERLAWMPLDLLWGASILKQGKNLIGLSTAKSLKKLGLPHLTFNDKVKVIFKSDQWKKYIQEKGLIRGMKEVTKDVVNGLPNANKLLPKYQPYTREILEKHGLRVGLFTKLEGITAKAVNNGKVIVGDAKYVLAGENLTLYNIFKDIKAFDVKQLEHFTKFKETHNAAKLYTKIQALLEKGVSPLEMVGQPLGKAPKNFFKMLFNGITETGRVKKLQGAMKEGMDLSEAMTKFREAQPLGKDAIVKVFDEFTNPGFDYEILLKAFQEAGMKGNFKNALKQVQSNFNIWSKSRTDEMKLTNLMMQLQDELNNMKHVRSSKLADKCLDVEKQLEANPEFFKEHGFKSATDYWLSLLDNTELLLLEEVAKKAPRGAHVKELKSVFLDFRTVMDTIRPLDWKKLAEGYKAYAPAEGLIRISTHSDDYADIIVNDANIFPEDGFGAVKSENIKLIEGKIEEAL